MSLEARVDKLEKKEPRRDFAAVRSPLQVACAIALALAMWKHQRPAECTPEYARHKAFVDRWQAGVDNRCEGHA